jgi:hypothetical protein
MLSMALGVASFAGAVRVGGTRSRWVKKCVPGLAALGLCIALGPGGVRADTIDLSPTIDDAFNFSFSATHGFVANGSTLHALAAGKFWLSGGTAQDLSGGFLLPDRVDIRLTVQHAVKPDTETQQGDVISFPTKRISASGLGDSHGNPIAAVGLSRLHPTSQQHFDNAIYNGSFSTSTGGLLANSISSYEIVMTAEHVTSQTTPRYNLATTMTGALEPSPVATLAYGSANGFLHGDTNQFHMTIALMNLGLSDVTDIVIDSGSAGFVPVHLGNSFLQDSTTDATVAVVGGGFFNIPSVDINAMGAGNSFINVLTHRNPGGEIRGSLDIVPLTVEVPEPSSLLLFAAGFPALAAYRWYRRRVGKPGLALNREEDIVDIHGRTSRCT